MAMNRINKKITQLLTVAFALVVSGSIIAAVDMKKFNKALKNGNWTIAKSIIQDAYNTPGQFKLARQLEQKYVEAEMKANVGDKDMFAKKQEKNEPTENNQGGNDGENQGSNGGGGTKEKSNVKEEEEEVIEEEKSGNFGGETSTETINELLKKELPTTVEEQKEQVKTLDATLTNLEEEIKRKSENQVDLQSKELEKEIEQLKEQEKALKEQKTNVEKAAVGA
jgi:hypothetical protein